MGAFVKLVQTGRVKGPQQSGYSEYEWSKQFATAGKADSVDTALYESGKWFHKEFTATRNITKQSIAYK